MAPTNSPVMLAVCLASVRALPGSLQAVTTAPHSAFLMTGIDGGVVLKSRSCLPQRDAAPSGPLAVRVSVDLRHFALGPPSPREKC